MEEALLAALASLFLIGWARDFIEGRFDMALSSLEDQTYEASMLDPDKKVIKSMDESARVLFY